jgi:phage/plasmid-associated DNA primase
MKSSLKSEENIIKKKNEDIDNEDLYKIQLKKIYAYRHEYIFKIKEVGKTTRELISQIKILTTISKEIQFDNNPYLLAFENAIYDLSINEFIKPNPLDYITMSCGYDYKSTYHIE